ncbi:unnamed protein product, partial [marine sediment metagenome]
MNRVLVVDDELNILEAARQMLQLKGYEVEVADCFTKAREKLKTGKIDLVITDLGMGAERGEDLLKEVTKEYPDIGVIIMTGYVDVQKAVECMRAGAENYLPKPFEMKEFLQMVGKYFETRNLKNEVVALKNLNERMKDLNEMKSNFICNVSHELRTPLTSIKAAMDLAGKAEADEKKKKLNVIINHNVKRMIILVRDLLDFSRMEKGMISINMKSCDMPHIISNAVA